MAQGFQEVFPTLQLKKKLEDLLAQTTVEKVSTNSKHDFLKIYLESNALIQKEDIWKAEQEIKQQLFPKAEMTVKIYEKFHLSGQYNVPKLLELYGGSILEELKAYNRVHYNAMKSADITCSDEGALELEMEDNVLFREVEPELVRILQKIISERCGLHCAIGVQYREPQESKYARDNERMVKMRVQAICQRIEGSEGVGGDGQQVPKDAAVAGSAAGEGKSAPDKNAFGEAKKKGADGKPQKKFEFKKGEGGRGGFSRSSKPSDNPDVIYGRDFEEEAIPIEDIMGEMGTVVIRGRVLGIEELKIKNEKSILIFQVTDFTDTMTVKIFTLTEGAPDLMKALGKGTFIKLKGMSMVDKFDKELSIGSVQGIKKIPDFTTTRMDTAAHKRVELHCHTKMSDMDGVSETKDIVKRAYKWGHKAIAITDHGVVQGFTDANHTWEDLFKGENKRRKEAEQPGIAKEDFFKVIYGVEAYLVDDLQEIVTGDTEESLQGEYVVFDIETTGFSPVKNRIIEIGAVKVNGGVITDRFSGYVNPKEPIPFEITKLTGITDEAVMDAPTIEEVLPQFLDFCEGCVLVAHNAGFDMSFIKENCRRLGYERSFAYVDTLGLSRALLTEQAKHTLDAVAKTLGVSLENHHRAVDDAECTAEIFIRFVQMLEEKQITDLTRVNALGEMSAETVSRLKSHHAIILAKNDLGRINLYRLISQSHLTYFNRFPKIPKSLVNKYRDGLILGSACEAGELYGALLEERSEEQIARLVNFYDYLEVQPVGNNQFMILSEKHPNINSVEDIQEVNRRVVALGEQFHKPVVATCDVHFLDPEDEVYRRIIMAGKGFKDADDQAPLYLHTTQEMLDEFAYLGSDKAYEIVVKNTNMIADMVETIAPVRPDKCPPVIENSDVTLREICENRAHEIYGPNLPPQVEERLERELKSIIGNGFAVM